MPKSESVQKNKADGRRERTQVTRRRILDASRNLILKGNLEPTAQAIASSVDMTTRTLFRHFPDMDSLFAEIIRDAESHAHAVIDEPFAQGTGGGEDWVQALDQIVARRSRVYEYLLPLYVSPVFQRHRFKNRDVKDEITQRRKRLKQVLPRELQRNKLLFEAIDGVLSVEYWISLRQVQQLSVKRAASVIWVAVLAMVQQESS